MEERRRLADDSQASSAPGFGILFRARHHVPGEVDHDFLGKVCYVVSIDTVVGAVTTAHVLVVGRLNFGTSLTTTDTGDAAFQQELVALEAEVQSKSDEHRSSTMDPESERPSPAAVNTGPEPAPASATEPSPETSADDADFARELAELEADLDSSPGRVSPKRTPPAQACSSSPRH